MNKTSHNKIKSFFKPNAEGGNSSMMTEAVETQVAAQEARGTSHPRATTKAKATTRVNKTRATTVRTPQVLPIKERNRASPDPS